MEIFKICLFFAVLTSSASIGLASSLEGADTETKSLVVLSRPRRDINSITRNLINELAENLQQSAARAAASLANFTAELQAEVQKFQEQLAQDINNLNTQVQEGIQQTIDKAQEVGAAVYECVENERGTAEELLNSTLYEVTNCATERIQQFAKQLAELAELTSKANAAAENALKLAQDCEDKGNIFAVGACLTQVLVETQVASATIVGQIGVLIIRLGLSLQSLPASLQACASARLAEAALRVASLVVDIGRCSITAIANTI